MEQRALYGIFQFTMHHKGLALYRRAVPHHARATGADSSCQQLHARFGNNPSVLKLRGAPPVGCHRRPVIGPGDVTGTACTTLAQLHTRTDTQKKCLAH